MTGKRFVQNTNLVMQNNEVYVVCGDEHSADVVTTALNELINENEQLKQRLKEYQQELYCKDRVLEENNISIECCDKNDR